MEPNSGIRKFNGFWREIILMLEDLKSFEQNLLENINFIKLRFDFAQFWDPDRHGKFEKLIALFIDGNQLHSFLMPLVVFGLNLLMTSG